MLPGFLSDVVALALLLPPVRGWIYAALASRVTVVETSSLRHTSGQTGPRLGGEGSIDLDQDDYRPR
ncbi:phage T7 F exclusion suppressor FxsA [compost metagenome]